MSQGKAGPPLLPPLMLALLAMLAGVPLAGWWGGNRHPTGISPATGATEMAVTPGLGIGGPFTLQGPAGQPVRLGDYQGRWVLLFFGYRYCPDVCPTELAKVARALEQLAAAEQARVTALFVSLDPERDSPAALQDYTALFHPAITGLTGTPAQVAEAARRYRVHYEKRTEGRGAEDYLLDHSAFLYLLDPDGRPRRLFTPRATADGLAQTLRGLLAEQSPTVPSLS